VYCAAAPAKDTDSKGLFLFTLWSVLACLCVDGHFIVYVFHSACC
jgi:hypothetical protein